MAQAHEVARDYICDAVIDVRQPYSNVAQYASDISGPQGGGSGNWPIQIAAGAEINNDANGQDLAPFLSGEAGWGLNGNEHGSSIYEAWNFASVVALLSHQPSSPLALTRWIKAEIAKYCLSIRFERPSRSVIFVEGEDDWKDRLRQQLGLGGLTLYPPDGWSLPTETLYGSRLYAVMPGSRQVQRNSNPTRPQESAINQDRSMMTPLIAWALDYSRRFPTGSIRSRHGWGWPVWLLEQCFGTPFEMACKPSDFGLEAEDVATFRRFLQHRDDPWLLLPYLEGYGTTSGQVCHWAQLSGGRQVSWINNTIHGSTTGCVACWTEGDTVFWASPQSTERSSGGAKCTANDDGLEAESTADKHLKNPPVSRFFDIDLRLRNTLWEVIWDKDGFRVVGAPPVTDPDPPPVDPDPPPPRPTAKQFETARETYARMGQAECDAEELDVFISTHELMDRLVHESQSDQSDANENSGQLRATRTVNSKAEGYWA